MANEDLYCPISHKIMAEPVTAADGITYERDFIERWLRDGHNTSPFTNAKLDHLHLNPNRLIYNQIQTHLREHPELLDADAEEEEVHLSESLIQKLKTAITSGRLNDVNEAVEKDKRLLTRVLTEEGKSAYHLAMEGPNPEIAALIVRKLTSLRLVGKVTALTNAGQAHFNPNHQRSMMQKFIEEQALEECDALVQLGVRADQWVDSSRRSLLHVAAEKGLLRSVQWLHANHPTLATKVCMQGDLPLHVAIRNKGDAIIRELLSSADTKGRQLAHQNGQKQSPLATLLLSDFNAAKRAELLVLFGVALAHARLPVLHIALRQNNPDLLDALLDGSPEAVRKRMLGEKDDQQLTPLCFQAQLGTVLIHHVNRSGRKVLQTRGMASWPAKKLLECKADLNATWGPNLQRPIHLAVQKFNTDLVPLLLLPAHGSPKQTANALQKDGKTPLHVLVESVLQLESCESLTTEFTKLVTLLMQAGAFIDATDNDGRTASNVAEAYGRADLATIIKKQSFDLGQWQSRHQDERIKQLEAQVAQQNQQLRAQDDQIKKLEASLVNQQQAGNQAQAVAQLKQQLADMQRWITQSMERERNERASLLLLERRIISLENQGMAPIAWRPRLQPQPVIPQNRFEEW